MTTRPVRNDFSDLRETLRQTQNERERAHAVVAEARAHVAVIRRILDPHIAFAQPGPPPPRDEVLRARADAINAEQRLARAELDALSADRRAEVADTDLRRVQLDEVRPRKRAAIDRLGRALLAARREVDALVAIEDEEELIVGGSVERFSASWCALASGRTPQFWPALDQWLAHTRNSDGVEG